jgi:hypothetical protein
VFHVECGRDRTIGNVVVRRSFGIQSTQLVARVVLTLGHHVMRDDGEFSFYGSD